MIRFMLKKLIGKLGKVLIKMGNHLLLLSRKNLVSIQRDNTVNGYKRDFQKQHLTLVK